MKRTGDRRAVQRVFWRAVREGVGVPAAAAAAGVSLTTGKTWVREGGGMPSISLLEPCGRYLSFEEREELALGVAARESVRSIARRLRRPPSTFSRELHRHGTRTGPNTWRYVASTAHRRAQETARRPKDRKVLTHPPLRTFLVEQIAGKHKLSPEQACRALIRDFPDDVLMRISPEAIYQSLYVQGRGSLRTELAGALRTGRAVRRPNHGAPKGSRGFQIKDKVMISERPPEIEDRSVSGHWEGDLIVGRNSASVVGTLVERNSRFVILLKLSDGKAETVRDAIAAQIMTLPAALRRSLTWDQGAELAEHVQLKLDTGLDIYFCDPKSPWQRGSNENTNGLLRQYLPKGTSLRGYSQADLDDIAFGLNGRLRKTLDWRTPAEVMAELLSAAS